MQTVPRLIDHFIPTNYQLSLRLDRTERVFEGVVTILGATTAGSQHVSLHSKDLAIDSVTIDGRSAEFDFEAHDELRITQSDLEVGTHVVVIVFSGSITDTMHGMYPCYFDHEGVKKELLATQFESHHAREVFPCIDEPEAKATFDVTLTTEQGITVLGNQPIEWQKVEDDSLVTCFQTTPHMSTYLLAWVTGELQHKSSKTTSGVEVGVWATPNQRPEALDFALEHTVKSIEFFENYFSTPYPLPKCDQVALPDFSSGAMENWGLVTYRESALLADPATTTVSGKQAIAVIVSHELSHQWFGNLVTMKWWNDLWLNESFATLMEYIAVDSIHPEWNIWLDFATHESILALRRDAIDGVQPVQVAVNHPDEINSLFDGAIVYAKGARLMRMCQDYIGHDAFRVGLANYFQEYAYKNTEADDLWRHLSESSGQDITRLMHAWIAQSGYPVVRVEPQQLKQEQFFIGPHESSEKIWPIPLDWEDPKTNPKLMDTATLDAHVSPGTRLNVDNASHFITLYNDEHFNGLLSRLTSFDDIGRLQLLNERSLLARSGSIKSVTLISLLDAYKSETSQNVWDIIGLTFSELKKFVDTDGIAESKLRSFSLELARPQFERLGWTIMNGEPESDTKLRSLAIGMMLYGEDPAVEATCLDYFAKGIEAVDPELRSLVIAAAVKRSDDDAIISTLLAQHAATHSSDLKDDICAGSTSARKASQISLLLEAMTDKAIIRRQDVFRWFAYLIRNRYARDQTWQWMVENWTWIEEHFGHDKTYDFYPQYAAHGLSTREQLSAYRTFFEPKSSNPALTRSIMLGINEIEGRVSTLENDGPAVITALKNRTS